MRNLFQSESNNNKQNNGITFEDIFNPAFFQLFYLSVYLMITFIIVGGAFYLTQKAALPYETHVTFEQIEKHMQNIQILVFALQKNTIYNNEQKCFGFLNIKNHGLPLQPRHFLKPIMVCIYLCLSLFFFLCVCRIFFYLFFKFFFTFCLNFGGVLTFFFALTPFL